MDDRPHPDLLESVEKSAAGTADPLGMTERLYKYASELLTRLEREDDKNDIKESVTCTKYLNDIVKQYLTLKKATTDDDSKSGSAVRKYAKAFAQNAAGGRKKGSRRPTPVDRDDSDDSDDAAE